jgi:signal transduction histidine kinase
MHAFEAETRFSERAHKILDRSELSLEDLRREYSHIVQQYGVLLNEVMKITRVSDSTQTELRRTRKELFVALQQAELQRNIAERLNKQKTEILSIAAHDLKNPLASIIGLVQLLRDDTVAQADKQHAIEVVESTGERMLTLIQNLLSTSALELGKMSPEITECDFLTIISEVIIANTTRAQHKGQTITFRHDDSSFSLLGDMTLLYEVCDNLLSNAVKYSPLNGLIEVNLTTHASSNSRNEQAPMLRLSIKDNGPGLTEEDKQKLFGYFQRLSAQPTAGESAHGIGLAVAKKITELHHGKIWAESRADEGIPGATFIVELPPVSEEEYIESLAR